MLSPDTRRLLREALAKMPSPVRLVCFERAAAGRAEAVRLAHELASLSDRLEVEALDLERDRAAAAAYRVSRTPTIAVVGVRDWGLRFIGVPGGHEIMALADAILLASAGVSGLSPGSRSLLADVRAALDILVFVAPT
jgi:alkyl hydroperoxide reductase subunit AhpF